jgi:hypothetical protein
MRNDARSGDSSTGAAVLEYCFRVNQINTSMERSLGRSLKSLVAASALLMAAYAIAAAPDLSFPGQPQSALSALAAPLSDIQRELDFGSARGSVVQSLSSAERDAEPGAGSPVLAWIFAGVCLSVALAQRRFFDR